MAPKTKGAKREAKTAAAAPPAKRERKERKDPMVEGVEDALARASLTEQCRAMLVAGVPHSLAVPSDQRHETQRAVVGMIGKEIEGIQQKLQEALDAELAKFAACETSKAGLAAKVEEAERASEDASQAVDAKAAALAQVAQALTSAKELLHKRQEEQRAGDAELAKAQESLTAFEKGLTEDFKALVEGASETVEVHYKALQPLFPQLALDESLLSALPSTCAKKASERGPFDAVVLDQLGASLKEKAADVARVVAEGAPSSTARAAAVEAAKAEVATAADAQRAAAEQQAEARADHKAAVEDVQRAADALAAHGPEIQRAAQARDDAARAIQDFRDYNLMCFEHLRDRAAAKVMPSETETNQVPVQVAAAGAGA